METPPRFSSRPRIRRALVILYVIGLFSLFSYAIYILIPLFSDQPSGPLYPAADKVRSFVPGVGILTLIILGLLGLGFLDRQLNRVTVIFLVLNFILIFFFLFVFWWPGSP
jgi:hypothetical protein